MSKAKQIIKLTEQGIKPKEIAKRTGAKISYVYFVRKRVKKGGKKRSPEIINVVQQLKNELDAYDKYKTKNTDLVNKPPHYTAGGIDFIDFAEAKGLTENAYLFNVVKYVVRAGKKADVDPVQDLEKAEYYLKREIARRKRA
jgi:hypothetical protein